MENKKSTIRLLSNICVGDRTTILGRNLFNLQRVLTCKANDLSSPYIKANLEFKRLPEEEQWRVPLILELIDTRHNKVNLDHF